MKEEEQGNEPTKEMDQKPEGIYSSRAYLQFASFYRQRVLGYEEEEELDENAEVENKKEKEAEVGFHSVQFVDLFLGF